MVYKITIPGQMGSLNEYIEACTTHVKSAGDLKRKSEYVCISNIRRAIKDTELKTPIVIHYGFYLPNAKKDRMNIASWFDKVFQDALQCKNGKGKSWLANDGWNYVYNTTHDFFIDKEHPRTEIIIEEVEEYVPQFDYFARVDSGKGASFHSDSSVRQIDTQNTETEFGAN
jgi:hypothetical protein